MMEPFANYGELITFISLFVFAVAIIPYAFIKMNEYFDWM